MIKLLFSIFLLASYSIGFSQCSNPISMDPPTVVHASCPGQGQITVGTVYPILGGGDFYQYSLFNTVANVEVFSWQNANVFPNLTGGSYQIRVRRKCTVSPYSSVGIITQNATVNNTEIITAINSVTVLRNSKCNNGVVEASAVGSGPLEYALVASLTEPEPVATYVRPRQPSNRFESLPAGNYFMRVYNSCNNASTIAFTIETDVSNARVEQINGSFIPIGCDSVSITFSVVDYFKNTTVFPSDLHVKAWVKWPSGTVDTLILPNQGLATLLSPFSRNLTLRKHISELDPAYNPSFVWPNNLTSSTYNIELGMRDNCNVLHTDIFTYIKPSNVYLYDRLMPTDASTDCDNAAYIFAVRHAGGGGTVTAQGFKFSDDFKYSLDGGLTWINARSSNLYTTSTGNSYSDVIVFPRGVSQTIMMDYCDTVLTTTFTPPMNVNLRSDLIANTNACFNRGSFRLRKYNANNSIMGVRVLSVPAGQPSIPYFEVTMPIGNDVYPTQLSNLMPGTYVIELLDTIGLACQLRRTLTVDILPFTFDFNFKVNCNKNLEITSTVPLGSSGSSLRVKIFNSLNVQVLGGTYGLPGSTPSYINIPGSTLASLPDGTYRIRVGRRLGTSVDDCSYIEKIWTKNTENNLNLQNSIFISGCDNGLGAIGASASGGTQPYSYTLRDINDIEIAPTSPGANTYNDLNDSQVYTLSVIDSCGSVVNRLISSNSEIQIAAPGYTNMPCVGDNFSLSLPQFTDVGYAWLKDGVLIPLETSNTLSFNGLQLSDSGTYQSVLTIGDCDIYGTLYINPLNCGGPLSVQLTSFNAYCDPYGATVLNWKTASELNSMHFILQKSMDLVNWETIEVLQARGNSSEQTNYTSLDRQPYEDVTYYQLIQRDIDGTEKRHGPISNSCTEEMTSTLKVYPNPTNGDFNLSYYSDKRTKLDLQIMDVNGRKIASEVLPLEMGSNNLFISEYLVPGVYIIHVKIGNIEMSPVKLLVN